MLRLGTKNSYDTEHLQVLPGPGWEGLTITATFVTPAGSTRVLVPDDGLLTVPPEAMTTALSHRSPGRIVFTGVADGVQRVTANVLYLVTDHAPVEGEDSHPTPSEFAQFVAQVQQNANAAAQSATEAANSATEAAGHASDAAGSAAQAGQSAKKADKSAQDAAAELEKVQGAGSAALQAIGSAQSTAVDAVRAAQQTGVDAVQGAQSTATQAIEQARQNALQDVEQAGITQTGAVNTAGQAQQTAVQQAGQTAIQQVQEAGTAQVDAVNQAGDAKLAEINAANALLPTPTEADAGKAVVVKPDGSGYELGDVQVDAYTKSEADARYAPIEAAIKVSCKGTGLVSLSPTVAWGMQGLKLYGRSWQDGTPSVETEVPIQSAGQSGSIDVQITDSGSQSQQLTIPAPDGLPGIPVDSGGNWVDEKGQQRVSNVIDLATKTKTQNAKKFVLSSDLSISSMSAYNTGAFNAGFWPFRVNSWIGKIIKDSRFLSNCFECKNSSWGYPGERAWTVETTVDFNVAFSVLGLTSESTSEEAIESLKQYANNHEIYFLCQLATPITTPLTDEELAAYKSLQSYPGTTNVLAQDAGIEASALADPTQYIEDKIQSAITQAVSQAVSLTGGNA